MNKTIVAGIAMGILVLALIIPSYDIEAKRIERFITTETLKSSMHRATGHESHQAIEILPPMENVLYQGVLSYTASKEVDVLIYHRADVEKAHEVNGIKYAVEKAASGKEGNARFVGDAILFHAADPEPFTVTVSVKAQARAKQGELPVFKPSMPETKPPVQIVNVTLGNVRTISVSEWQPWFQPAALQIEPGTPVVWDASETASVHTITFVTRITDLKLNMDPEFTAKTFTLLAPGDKSAPFIPDAGVYVYICAIHPYMTGVISAGIPYNAITGLEGAGKGDITVEKFAPWYASVAPWPDNRPFKDPPKEPGVGEVWIDTQFEVAKDPNSIGSKFTYPWPGTVTVVDAEKWSVKKSIKGAFNGPHNLDVSPDGKFVIQTNWHDDYITLIDAQTKEIVKNYIQTGMDPAHIAWTEKNEIIVSINAGTELQIFDGNQITDPNVPASEIKPVASIKATVPMAGPHGIWYRDRMVSVPYHLANKAVIVSVDEKKELFEPINTSELEDPKGGKIGAGVNLASYIGPEINGHRFWVTSEVMLDHSKLLQGRLILYDIGSAVGGASNPKLVKILETGSIPIQTPISPDGRFVVTATSGGLGVPGKIYVTELDYNNPENSKNVAIIDSYPGSHGVTYGYKKSGGLYAYVTNKFAPVLQVIDLTEKPVLAGEVDLGNGWGGMGVVANPSAGYYPSLETHPLGRLYK